MSRKDAITLFSVTVTPRACETDMLGHINNTSIAVWFEELRTRYLNHLRDTGDGLPPLNLLLVSVTLDYLDETFYGTDVIMTVRSVDVGNTSLTMEGDMHQDGRHVVKARAVLVSCNPETRRPQRINDAYRERIAAG